MRARQCDEKRLQAPDCMHVKSAIQEYLLFSLYLFTEASQGNKCQNILGQGKERVLVELVPVFAFPSPKTLLKIYLLDVLTRG